MRMAQGPVTRWEEEIRDTGARLETHRRPLAGLLAAHGCGFCVGAALNRFVLVLFGIGLYRCCFESACMGAASNRGSESRVSQVIPNQQTPRARAPRV